MKARDIAAAVQSGKKSAEHFAQEALARVTAYEAVQPEAWISRFSAEHVLAMARAVDARVAMGEKLALAGVPFAVKDNIDVAGLPTTMACPGAAFAPERSAHVVDLLVKAGAIPLGKTNLDQFATGLVGVRSPYGAPQCVFNREFVSGGSSSGSAVATAAGLVAFALGTDTAGSGRVPAAINHLIGLKPTKGRYSTSGVFPACRSLDCVSVFARDVADAALIDGVMNAFDAADIYSRHAEQAGKAGKTFRLGVPAKALDFFGDAESAALFEAAKARLKKLGAEIVAVDAEPLLTCANLLYAGPWVAERSAAMKGIDPAIVHPVVRGIVEGGKKFSAVEAFDGQYALKQYERAAQALWEEIDVLLLPTAPTIFTIEAVRADPVALNSQLGRYTNFVNLLDMSALALPAGFRKNATGFGITLIGPAWADDLLLALGARYEENFPMADIPPLDTSPRAETVKLAVVGAHLQGMPLHHQLTSRNARFVKACKSAASYKLYAIANSTPPKPALVFAEGGSAIELEVYELDMAAFGSFTAEVPAPLAIGTVTLDDGSTVKGFVAEPRALIGAEEITKFGGWRAFLASQK